MGKSTSQVSLSKKLLLLLLKIAVTVTCLWYVFTKIDFNEAWAVLKKTNWAWLLAAFLIYNFSKFIASKRLNIYFKNIGLKLSEWQNIKLYWLGMFYNLFLPGAITGDAYKVILLSKRFQTPYKKIAAAVLLDRFSGLLSLGLIMATYSSFAVKEKWIVIILIIGALLAIPFLYFIIKKFFPDFLSGFCPAFLLGTAVQITVLLSVYFILFAMDIQEETYSYVFIFLVATIASVLPISVGGGLGVREFVIIEGAKFAGLGEQGQHTALILSLLYYLTTVACSLIGLLFIFKEPLKPNTITSR